MSITDYHDFTFESDKHEYRDGSGIVRLSITQAMKLVGIYNYDNVPPEVLENARRRGSNVHEWCAEWDRTGDIDRTWIADDECPYFDGWVRFSKDSGLKVIKVETPVMRTIDGVVLAGTPDVIGMIGSNPFVIERKACRTKHPGWGIQTALQEMLETGKSRVGHMGRMAVQLMPNATYKAHIHDDPSDGEVARAILQRIGSDEAINTWMKNNNIAA